MGDLMQRMNDHSRVNNFLTQQTTNSLDANNERMIVDRHLSNWRCKSIYVAMICSAIHGFNSDTSNTI
ncbi:hypothetical protein [Segatella albensis]|uniref:hypothetical protein n=1 Tax=Segatella albensis TaxID=77768 RepID=UPI0012B64DC2|nr:hypothetical protein [Segatella albensis]